MSTAAGRQEQRDAWRRAAAQAAAAKRTQRGRRRPLEDMATIGPGMIRAAPSSLHAEMSTSSASDVLPRCSFPGCPVRWVNGGEDRPCRDHAGDGGVHEAAAALGIDLAMIETTPEGR
jgi:hypothetical protein